jgi:hypothetical protein
MLDSVEEEKDTELFITVMTTELCVIVIFFVCLFVRSTVLTVTEVLEANPAPWDRSITHNLHSQPSYIEQEVPGSINRLLSFDKTQAA